MNEARRIPKFSDICKTAAAVNCLKGGQKVSDVAKSAGTYPGAVRRMVNKAGFKKKYGQWRHVSECAKMAVDLLLETELVRVCSSCEQEFGPVTIQPGQHKSHGLCKRHMREMYKDFWGPSYENRPDSDFPPDRGQPPAKSSFYPGAGPSSI